ncbi:MAG: hypothetical protein WC900_08885 [Oscillospiraceae bacterium]|jgi:hypothetical protein
MEKLIFFIMFFVIFAMLPFVIVIINFKTYKSTEHNPLKMSVKSFTVSAKKRNLRTGLICIVLLCLLFSLYFTFDGSLLEIVRKPVIYSTVLAYAMSLYLILSGMRWRLVVEGDKAVLTSSFSSPIEFLVSDIIRVIIKSEACFITLKTNRMLTVLKKNVGYELLIKRLEEEQIFFE